MKEQEKQTTPGYVEWWEFSPQNDTFVCSVTPDRTKKESETGIIIDTTESVIQDRPTQGTIISVGPTCPYNVNDYIFWAPTSGFDLAMIRPEEDDQKFILLHPDAVLGLKNTTKPVAPKDVS
jgi:co-chaperonin GroES (HSP10)